MCGIVGYIGSKKVVPVIIEGLRKLEYRGYDSAGIAVVGTDGKLEVRRAPGKLRKLEEAIQKAPLDGTYGIGHGIAAIRDPNLTAILAEREIPLEICPTSNLRTKALDIQLNTANPKISDHPLPKLYRAGVPVSLSTDDPEMFCTNLTGEYLHAYEMGLSVEELLRINRAAFDQSFLPDKERGTHLAALEKYSSQPER